MSEPEHTMNVDLGGGRSAVRKVNYPSNSNKAKQADLTAVEGARKERPPNEKVVNGVVTRRKSSGNGVIGFIISEVLIPSSKKLLSDIVTQGFDMIGDAVQQGIHRKMFGDSMPLPRSGSRSGYTSYNRVNRPSVGVSTYGNREISRHSRANHNFDEIILSDRTEAEEVIERLRDLVDRFEQATVNDLYEIIGIEGSFTDDKWGWTNLRRAGIRAIRGGYLLDLPRTEALE